jgi:hypothetical protein
MSAFATATTNPLKEDDQLQRLLAQVDDIKTKNEFSAWRASFLKQYEKYLDPSGVGVASEALHALDALLKKLVSLVNKLQGHLREGELSTDKCTVKARHSLAEFHKQTTAVISALEHLIPSSTEKENEEGYNKFHVGAVLIRDGFIEYTHLSLCDQIFLSFQKGSLGEIADRQILAEMERFHSQIEGFVHILSDLGLYNAMKKSRELSEQQHDESKTITEIFLEGMETVTSGSQDDVEINQSPPHIAPSRKAAPQQVVKVKTISDDDDSSITSFAEESVASSYIPIVEVKATKPPPAAPTVVSKNKVKAIKPKQKPNIAPAPDKKRTKPKAEGVVAMNAVQSIPDKSARVYGSDSINEAHRVCVTGSPAKETDKFNVYGSDAINPEARIFSTKSPVQKKTMPSGSDSGERQSTPEKNAGAYGSDSINEANRVYATRPSPPDNDKFNVYGSDAIDPGSRIFVASPSTQPPLKTRSDGSGNTLPTKEETRVYGSNASNGEDTRVYGSNATGTEDTRVYGSNIPSNSPRTEDTRVYGSNVENDSDARVYGSGTPSTEKSRSGTGKAGNKGKSKPSKKQNPIPKETTRVYGSEGSAAIPRNTTRVRGSDDDIRVYGGEVDNPISRDTTRVRGSNDDIRVYGGESDERIPRDTTRVHGSNDDIRVYGGEVDSSIPRDTTRVSGSSDDIRVYGGEADTSLPRDTTRVSGSSDDIRVYGGEADDGIPRDTTRIRGSNEDIRVYAGHADESTHRQRNHSSGDEIRVYGSDGDGASTKKLSSEDTRVWGSDAAEPKVERLQVVVEYGGDDDSSAPSTTDKKKKKTKVIATTTTETTCTTDLHTDVFRRKLGKDLAPDEAEEDEGEESTTEQENESSAPNSKKKTKTISTTTSETTCTTDLHTDVFRRKIPKGEENEIIPESLPLPGVAVGEPIDDDQESATRGKKKKTISTTKTETTSSTDLHTEMTRRKLEMNTSTSGNTEQGETTQDASAKPDSQKKLFRKPMPKSLSSSSVVRGNATRGTSVNPDPTPSASTESGPPMVRKVNRSISLRPGTVRGSSFDEDESKQPQRAFSVRPDTLRGESIHDNESPPEKGPSDRQKLNRHRSSPDDIASMKFVGGQAIDPNSVASALTMSSTSDSTVSTEVSSKLPPMTEAEKQVKREKCYIWYARMGLPNRKDMKRRVSEMPESCGITADDVDLLPWVAGGMSLSVKKMNELFLTDATIHGSRHSAPFKTHEKPPAEPEKEKFSPISPKKAEPAPVKPEPVVPEKGANGSKKSTEEERRKDCYIWYARMGTPSKKEMKRRVALLPESCGITPDDVDLLPWILGGMTLSVHKMNSLMTGD